MAICPDCDYDDIETEDYEEGDNLNCPECGTELVLLAGDELEAVAADDDLDDDLDEEEDELEDAVADEEEHEA
jgi:alpha-aminoadipate/glutamate carrier protein LysW